MASPDSEKDPARKEEPYNVFRDSALRFMGYANEVGESFRYQVPRLVTPTYVLAFGYCAADAISSGYRVWEEGGNHKISPSSSASESASEQNESKISSSREIMAAMATCDTLIWQSFASVLIPGGTINIIVRASRFAMLRATMLPVSAQKWIPTISGLGSIPFIVHPIDDFVDYAMDNSIRKWLKK
jgi:fission process protein 1